MIEKIEISQGSAHVRTYGHAHEPTHEHVGGEGGHGPADGSGDEENGGEQDGIPA